LVEHLNNSSEFIPKEEENAWSTQDTSHIALLFQFYVSPLCL
jgi:hypothetical protein